MKTRIVKFTTVLFTAVIFFSFDVPDGWIKKGSHPDSYEMGIDKGTGQDGKNSATIKSKEDDIQGFGTLMQASSPEKYLGKKIKMTGYLKTEKVSGWTGLWLRVDDADSQPLSFDNMYDKGITGTTGWTKYEIILDVPANASNLAYGALLNGSGQIWFDNITFEEAGSSDIKGEVKKSDAKINNNEPVNLDFEK